MATLPPEPENPPPSSPWGLLLFGGIFVLAAVLIFIATLHGGSAAPATEPAIAASTPAAISSPLPATHTQPAASSSPAMPTLPLHYPPTRTVDASDVHFGVTVHDPYRWLEDGKSPEVKTWLDAQNHLARSFLDALPGRAALEQRYADLLHIDTITAPSRAGDRYFYMKRQADQQKAIFYWKSALNPDDTDHVLLDPNLYNDTTHASLGDTAVTLDGRLLAYTLRPNNADEATLYVRDVATGKDLSGEVITGAKYADPSWMPDGSGFVYTYLPPATTGDVADRPGLAVVRYHRLGTDPKNDPVLHGKTGDPTKFIGAGISRDGKWIFFEQQNGWDKNDIYYQPLHGQPTAALAKTWKPIVVGEPYTYSLQAWKGEGYILTNEAAPHYRLYKVSLGDPRRANWREIVPTSSDRVLNGVSIIGDQLVLDYLHNVIDEIEIHDLDGKLVRKLELPGLGSVSELAGEPDHDTFFYGFDNFTTPPEIFQTSISDPAQKLWAKINIPVDSAPYVVEQKWFTSKDGTRVPMFLVHRKDMPMNGTTPFLIYGYGGFDESMTPFFSPGYYPFLEAGGGYALVNLRGGGEFGEKWHQDGMLLKKQHVFDDCIAAAEYLIKQGYTSPAHLGLRGGSNGGLLVGAVLTQRPDLFRAMVCEVPLLDMIRYVKFGSGKTWVPEYGSPDNEAQFKALYAYSPYHHVVKGTAYPAVLFCTAANDDRVDGMHARKMAAELQADTGSSSPILLRVEDHSGHGGGGEVKKTIVYATDIWGFLIDELGAKPAAYTPK
jgi:prolyl oligopeptidase